MLRGMDFAPITLEGRFTRLEPLSMEHLDQLCEVGLDEELWRFTQTNIQSKDDMRAYIGAALQLQSEGSALPFATIDRATGRVAGSSRYGSIDRSNRRAEIGWTWLGRSFQRTALNTEAKFLMLRHAFEGLGCIRVEFKTDSLNERSRRALARVGAKEEGTLRNHMITPSGRLRHSVYFSVIDAEWPDVKAGLDEKLARVYGAPL
jgi:RimJ/RimL family protein N-acetyltransferase